MAPRPGELASMKAAPNWEVSEYQMLSHRFFQIENNSDMRGYIIQVLDKNSDLKSVAATVKAAGYELNATQASRWPQAGLELSHTRNKDALSKEIGHTTSVDLDINWVLDIWGKLSDETKAAHYSSHRSQHDLAQAKRALVMQAAQSWVEYWGNTRNKVWLTRLNRLNTDLLEHYQEDYVAGLVPYEFVLDARKRKKSVQSQLWEVRLQTQKLRHYMNVLRARPPHDELVINNALIPKVLVAYAGDLEATTLVNRPDIQAAFSEMRAFEFSAFAAHKALLPQITLSGSALKSGKSLDDALSGDLIWQFIGGLTQPLFNAGQLRALAKQKSAQAEAAWWQYQHIVLNAMREVEDALAGDTQLARQLAQKQTELSDLIKKAGSAKGRFRDGELQLDELFLVLFEKAEAEIEVVDVEVAYLKNRLSLIAALGLPIEALWEVADGDS
jgi:outer membrane protein TolC